LVRNQDEVNNWKMGNHLKSPNDNRGSIRFLNTFTVGTAPVVYLVLVSYQFNRGGV